MSAFIPEEDSEDELTRKDEEEQILWVEEDGVFTLCDPRQFREFSSYVIDLTIRLRRLEVVVKKYRGGPIVG